MEADHRDAAGRTTRKTSAKTMPTLSSGMWISDQNSRAPSALQSPCFRLVIDPTS